MQVVVATLKWRMFDSCERTIALTTKDTDGPEVTDKIATVLRMSALRLAACALFSQYSKDVVMSRGTSPNQRRLLEIILLLPSYLRFRDHPLPQPARVNCWEVNRSSLGSIAD